MTPILTRFLQRHPRVEVDLRVEDRLVDVVAEGLDAGIRMSEALERDMVQVRLSGGFRFVVVGAPAYLKRWGTPERPKDLLAHDCLCIRSETTGAICQWELERGQRSWRAAPCAWCWSPTRPGWRAASSTSPAARRCRPPSAPSWTWRAR